MKSPLTGGISLRHRLGTIAGRSAAPDDVSGGLQATRKAALQHGVGRPFFVFGVAYVLLGVAPYRWHYSPLVPALAVLATLGMRWLAARIEAKSGRATLVALAGGDLRPLSGAPAAAIGPLGLGVCPAPEATYPLHALPLDPFHAL